MAFGFFTRTAKRIRDATRTAYNQILSQIRTSVTITTRQESSISATAVNLDKAEARIRAVAHVVLDHSVPNIVVEELAKEARDSIKETLKPIRASGKLEDSIRARPLRAGTWGVVTDHPGAFTVQEGPLHPPPPEKLIPWMESKADFANMTHKERRRIAFAIYFFYKNGKGQNVTGKSTIGNLPPSGERKFAYVTEALKTLSPAIDQIGRVVAGALVNES